MYAISIVKTSRSLTGNLYKGVMVNVIKEFAILKHWNIDIHPKKVINITHINWRTLPMGMIKCNVDGVARGSGGAT